jgi:glycosyltransferase involved in cell wall biosynthesis
MHVALNGWFWDQPHTGSGQYLRNLLKALAKLDADLDLTLIVPEHVRNFDGLPETIGIAHAATRFSGKVGKVWFEQRTYPATVQRVQADLAHIPYWGAPLSSPARLVVSVLDVIPLVLPVYRGGLFPTLYTSLVAAGAKGAGHILTLSDASKADIIKRLGISTEHITVTHLAADERFSPTPNPQQDEAVRRKYDLPDEFALYLGGFDVRKNVNTLLLAWTYVGQPMDIHVPLVLAGSQPKQWGTPLFPDLPGYAKNLNIDKYLMWVGEVDEADKPSLYRLAKVVIFPSLYEGFGLPPLEAMACGTPVVAANASSIPEVVGEAAYLVDPQNAREMGGAILAVLVQDDLHHHLANLGRGRATQFSWRKTAQKTLSVYEQMMKA